MPKAQHITHPIFFYQVTVILHDGSVKTGIDSTQQRDIDQAYITYRAKAMEKFEGLVQDFECVQLSNHSRLVKAYIKEKNMHIVKSRPYSDDFGDIPDERIEPPKDIFANKREYGKRGTKWKG